jgi:hypothetical protein
MVAGEKAVRMVAGRSGDKAAMRVAGGTEEKAAKMFGAELYKGQ